MEHIARAIFDAGVNSVRAYESTMASFRLDGETLFVEGGGEFDLSQIENIYVLGCGKSTPGMAQAVEDLLGSRITAGAINTKDGHSEPLKIIETQEASHPIPDERGAAGTEKILELARKAGPRDLVITLISGGGSALMLAPAEGLTLEDKIGTTRALLSVGANIHEVNTVRKHLSAVKGGQLARACYPAQVINIMMSDVIGDKLESIASGPLAPDPTTFKDVDAVMREFDLWDKIPAAARDRLQAGLKGDIEETPKAGSEFLTGVHHHVCANNLRASRFAAAKAVELGYRTMILTTSCEGEAREVGKVLSALARELEATGNPIGPPACLIIGGETTVTLQGDGKGGRNQEIALAAAMDMTDLGPDTIVLSGGTDGTDGPTDAGGAWAKADTIARAEALGLDPLNFIRRSDSYHFHQELGTLLMTGPTGTNVMDLMIVIVGRP